MTKSYDTHTLFLKCDCASTKQIQDSMRESLKKYQNEHGVKLDCRWRVNVISNHEGELFGIAFVFVTNPAVYHMLLGKNPDGSDRVEFVDDPSCSGLLEGTGTNESGWNTIEEPKLPEKPEYPAGMSWADMSEVEEEYDEALAEYERKLQSYNNRFIRPKIQIQLEPLMILPPFKLTPEQIENKRRKIIAKNEIKSEFDPNMVEIPEFSYFGVDRAMVVPVDEKFMPNILKCKNVPEWITQADLKAQFSPYADDSQTIQERFVKGRRLEETYPFVNINNDRVAFIIFDNKTTNAQFALHMMKKTVISKKMPDGTVNTFTLVFGHSFRTDRDIMSDINHQTRSVQRRNDIVSDINHQTRSVQRRDDVNSRRSSEKRGQRGASKTTFKKQQPQQIHNSNPFAILKNND